jgi:hypothetical protein
MGTSKKEDGARQCMQHAHVHEKKIFSCVRAQETQQNHRTKALLWACMHDQRDCGFEHAQK